MNRLGNGGTQGSFGPDRITHRIIEYAGLTDTVQTGYGTPLQRDEIKYIHTANGRVATIRDANGNLTTYGYDGFDRLTRTNYPSPTTPGTSSTTDYEQLTPDANGNVTSLRLRDGTTIGYGYDALDRLTGTSTCRTGSSPGCIGIADETVATIAYGSTGVANNLLPTSTTAAAGDGSLSATSTLTYDAIGNPRVYDGPLPGTADVGKYLFDADRVLVGDLPPAPGGSSYHRAIRYSYTADGRLAEVERGKLQYLSTPWSQFASLQQLTIVYDAADGPSQNTLTAGGTTYAVIGCSCSARWHGAPSGRSSPFPIFAARSGR